MCAYLDTEREKISTKRSCGLKKDDWLSKLNKFIFFIVVVKTVRRSVKKGEIPVTVPLMIILQS
jgi:hypothetical protein